MALFTLPSSKLDVRFTTVGEVAEVGTGNSDRNHETVSGAYPLYVRSREILTTDNYEFDEEAIVIPEEGGVGEIFHFVSGKYALHQRAYRISFRHPGVNPKYAYYFFQANFKKYISRKSVSATVTSIRRPMITDFKIGLPSLDVQAEIVRTLDTFTALEAELVAELEARVKQFGAYLEHFFLPKTDWIDVTLGDLAYIFDGPHSTPAKTSEGPWYLSISSLKSGNFDFNESAHLAEKDLAAWTKRVSPLRGDTLFSYETRLGQAAYWDSDQPAALGRRMGLLRPKERLTTPKFLTWLYLSPAFQQLIKSRTVKGSTVDRFPIANMEKWPVTIPPLKEQAMIVEALEAFDELCNRPGSGLHAEITARKKQYEYYRDRLLTFEEA